MRPPVFLLVLVCLFSATNAFSQAVNEVETTVSIQAKEAVVKLAVESDSDMAGVQAGLELLNTAGAVKSFRNANDLRLKKGKQIIEFRMPLAAVNTNENEYIAWYRLRYRIGNASGVVSMSQVIRDFFELRIIASENLLSGMTYRVRVRAFNPFTAQAALGVKVNIAVELDLQGDGDQKLKLNSSGETGADGFAVVDFTIPAETKLDGDGEITVTGQKNGILRKADEDINALKEDIQIISLTDKPIYQPEQMLNIRGIVLKGGEAKTVLAGSELEFRITDDDDTLLYRERVRSSDFGVVSIGWRIPANAKLGDYRIEIRDEEGDQIGGHQIKVSRYDLPNFVVEAKAAKPYYLPGDTQVEVEVRADYLFGKPVTKGTVRVVEENSRVWNWKEQKYDIDEGEIREGTINSEGKFIAKFDIKEEHEDLKDDDWRKYKDIKFAAYFTDLTTNKTEQRRFDVRVSREPIHVYLISQHYESNPKLPITAYVSTFYADGSPAECDVEVKASEEDEDKFKSVGRLKTNSYGAGKFTIMRPAIGDPDDDLDFRLIAKDKSGRRGTLEDEISFDEDDEAIHVATDRAIYKPGESITVSINSTIKSGPVYLDVISGWSVIDSRFAELKDGKAELRIPYSDAFKGELKIAAFIEEDENEIVRTSRGVIFPAKQGISVDSSFDKAVYKPNEEATVKFGVVDAIGTAIESVLGVVVLDKAVEERARTDSEFGGVFRNLGGWLGYGDGFGTVNVKDLNELDLTKPISDDLQLVAEVILHDSYYEPNVFRSNSYYNEAKSVFGVAIKKQFEPVEAALNISYTKLNYLHPVNDASLRSILDTHNINFDEMRDPWDMPYRATFSVSKERNVVAITSGGPDKQFETKDDFTAFTAGFAYFTPMGNAIDTVVRNYHARTGDFIREEKTLLAELGVRELLDRFGRSYKFVFEPEGRYLKVRVRSGGDDGKFEKYDYYGDDFYVWTNQIDYFATNEKRITETQSSVKSIPMNEAEFRASLKFGGVDFGSLRDGYGNPLYITVQKTSRYWDRVTIENIQIYGETKRTERRTVTPVTQQIVRFTIRSSGRDGKSGNYDDFTLTQYVHVLSEQAKDDPKPVPLFQRIADSNSTGSIAGVVTDANGAVIPNATVIATNTVIGVSRTVSTNADGQFLITNLAAGTYVLKVEATGFKNVILQSIPVKANATAQADVVLDTGDVSATVEVTSGAESIDTTNASLSVNGARQITSLPLNTRNALQLIQLQPGVSGTGHEKSTPRLREYFPETLVWQPEIVTDANGKAEIKFRMADNITTWKMYTIASTKNGKIGVAEKEVTAFQSFFVDLNPPKFLTNGDEIYLPTQVRNYTEKKQSVNVTMTKADWFLMLSEGTRQVGVASGKSENVVFGFKAVMPVVDGKQRVTAIAETDSDAIERPVTVRPDGREIVKTDSRYFTGAEKFDVNFPTNAIQRTQRAELKIYPNLMAHVAESVEGLLRRPYGCGEQTISSTYPNVMILKFAIPGEEKPRRISISVEKKARKYLQNGYERLLGYQVADGGFSYWGGKDQADFALTAYALRFLTDASAFVAVDPDVVKKAESWLIKQQRSDGSWNKKYHWEEKEDERRTKIITTYVARTLAMVAARQAEPSESAGGVNPSIGRQALTKALDYLKMRNAEIDDPYSLALFGLAALDAGDVTLANSAAQKLITLAKGESGGAYWNLESNTAFNGWGAAGRVETTALVAQLFLKLNKNSSDTAERDLIGKAMTFLLKNKDRYGVWYSTQTTVNVLDAFVASMAETNGKSQTLQVLVNGTAVENIEISSDKLDQIVLDLEGKLAADNNVVELKSSDRNPLMAQVVANHYVDWKDADASGRTVNQSRALQLDYKCDRTEAAIMQEVSCSVSAERVGFQGYGMLLAEIGTPPGADVSRESLEAAMENDWSLSRYDILPDRIVVYMWAKSGGTNINFKFRQRYGINAQTPPSVVYDYYNPEAQATISPIRFQVK